MRIAITAGSRGIRNGNIITKAVLGKAPILFAIPCMENAYDETCRIEAVAPEDILTREPELLMKGEAE
jgi:predicted RNase H-like nuclease